MVGDDLGLAAQPAEPRGDVLWIRHRPGEQQELQVPRRGKQHPLVVIPAVRIRQPMVLIDRKEPEGLPQTAIRRVDDPPLHRLQGRDDHRGLRPHAEVSGHDAHLPTPRAPLGELIVGQGPRRHGEKRSPTKRGLLHPAFEHVGLSGPRWCADNHIPARPQALQSQRLPPVGQHQLLQAGEGVVEHGPKVPAAPSPSIGRAFPSRYATLRARPRSPRARCARCAPAAGRKGHRPDPPRRDGCDRAP